MPNEIQRIMDRLTEKLPNTHCFLNDTLIGTLIIFMDRLTEKLPNTHCFLKDTLIATLISQKHCKLVFDLL